MNNEQSAAKSLNDKLIDSYNEGKSLRELESEYNISRYKIRKMMTDSDITIDSKKRHTDYTVKANTFKKINTPEKAYWLGFLYADACLTSSNNNYKVELTLKESDKYHVEKFQRFLQSTHPVKKIENGNAGHFAYKIMIGNKELFEDLVKLGCTPRKSQTIKFPFGKMPTTLIRHFVRGYFDGDGGLHKPKGTERLILTFTCANYDFLTDLYKVLPTTRNHHGITSHKIANCHELRYGSKVDIKMIYDYLYTDSTIHLNRKYQLFNSMFWITENAVSLEKGSETIMLQSSEEED